MIKELTIESEHLPNGWEIKTLGDITSFQRGLTYGGKDVVDFSEKIVLRATNIDLDKSCLDFSELKYLNNDFQVKQNKKVVKGSLLICLSSGSKSHLGKVALVTDDYNYAFGGFIGQIIPDNQVISKYLFYNLISDSYKKYISRLTDGIGINNLKSIDLKSFEIPLPPLTEQKEIVSTLDKAFAAIEKAKANAEQNLQNAKELFQSYLQEVFENKEGEWKKRTLKEVCIINPKKSEIKDLPDDYLVSFLPMKDLGIAQNQINPIVTKKLSEVKGSYTYFKDDDILLAKVTPCFENGKLGIARKLVNGIGFGSSEYIVFRTKGEIHSDYLFLILSSNKFRNRGKELMFGAVGLKRLSKDYVENFLMFLPPLDEQTKIIKKVYKLSNSVKTLKGIYTQKIADLEEMKKSILKKAFSGKLNTLN